MSRTFGFLTAIAITASLTLNLLCPSAAIADDFLVPGSKAYLAGLKVQWDSQISFGGRFKMVDWFLQIDENTSTTYFVLEAGLVREVVSSRQLNRRGEPFGIDGAKKEIEFRKEHIEARIRIRNIKDVEVKVSSYTLPKSVLYILSSDGLITALDADTGNILWDRSVGDGSLNVIGLGASNDNVVAVIGSTVHCLNAVDGREMWSKETNNSPSAAPAVSSTRVLVPLANGRLQSFSIENEGFGSNTFFASGYATSRPLIMGDKVAWATDTGQLNLATPDASRAVGYRLDASDSIVASPTASGNRVFAASIDGFVYCLDQERGRLLWEVTTGASVNDSPVPIGKFVYVVTESNQLFKMDAETGQFAPNWETPASGVTKFLSATENSVFVLGENNTLKVIDKSTRNVISSVPIGTVDLVLTNYQTDRIYLATKTGQIQCVREAASEKPFFHDTDSIAAVGGSGEAGGSGRKPTPFETGEQKDPFATEDDPFAVGDEPADAGQPAAEEEEVDDGNPFN